MGSNGGHESGYDIGHDIGQDDHALTAAPRHRLRIGLLGGTFDPIHAGHLALAGWARDELKLDQVRLIPTGHSWQKQQSVTGPVDRLAMAHLAGAGLPWLQVDDREIRRGGSTYTVDTLTDLRAEVGPDTALVWLLGSDQLHNLATWDRYEELLDLAHLAVTQRERIALRDFPAPVEALLKKHGAQTLSDAPNGTIVFFRMPPVPVSATVLRQRLAAGDRPAELVPPPVLDYIDRVGLYRPPATT